MYKDPFPHPDVTDAEVLADSPLPTTEGLLGDLLWAPVATRPQGVTRHGGLVLSRQRTSWRLAREGPFLAEQSSTVLSSFGAGCAFRNTTYRASDYDSPSDEFGVPFFGGPGRWLNSLSWDQAMAAAIQLHRDVCLMTTNLDILDQYALSLHGTASKMLEMSLGSSDFPSADMAAGALGPRVRHASVQIEAMGLWLPSLDPILLT